ncbi:MAG TPA: HD-GYP domain-containing protein [Actinomycetota bacterium]|nr:HD-GYP domain-containing protein [Actinomycetota bacterium]
MNGHEPSEALQEAHRFLRSVAAALQAYGLYEAGHPGRTAAAAEVEARAVRLRDALGRDPVLFLARRSFYLGLTLLAWPSLSLHRLAEAFEAAGIESLELLPGLDRDDVDALVRLLGGEERARDELSRILLNRATPELPLEGGLAELLQSYAQGLELLREAASRLLAGRPANVEAARRLTEHLAERISADPAQALLLTTVKSYDEYTFHHMVNVCVLAIALAQAVGLEHERVITLGIGALLHDVGKVRVPQEVLQHQGKLDEEQWRLIQRHPVDGAGLVFVTSRDLLHPAAAVVLEHHVAFDASGYPPLGARRPPSLPARLVSVVDCFDAVTSKRPYRAAEERRQALALLQAGAGRGFDPRLVRAFLRLMGLFPVGSLVQLSTGEVGVVVRNHERLLARPTVRLLLDASGTPCDAEERDLAEERPGGGYRWDVARSVDPAELGIDMLQLLASGRLEERPPDEGPGLVHEPSPGEPPPPGYVEAHPAPEDLPPLDREA